MKLNSYFRPGPAAATKIAQCAFLVLIYFSASALVLDNFMKVHGDIVHRKGVTFATYLNFRTERPFSYRILIPDIAAALDSVVSGNLTTKLRNKFEHQSDLISTYMHADPTAGVGLDTSIRYHIAYVLVFLSILGWLFASRLIALQFFPADHLVASLIPLCLACLAQVVYFPSAFLYDFPEMMFLSLALYAAMDRRFLLLAIVYPLSILNKESDVLIILYFLSFNISRTDRAKLLVETLCLLVIGGLALFASHYQARDFAGAPVQFHLVENLHFILNISSYWLFFQPTAPYVFFPEGYNLVYLALVIWLALFRWADRPSSLRRLLLWCSVANIPLVIAFGQRDEIRNFSVVFPPLFATACWVMNEIYRPPGARDSHVSRPS